VLYRDEVVAGFPELIGRQLLGVIAVAVAAVLALCLSKVVTEIMGHAVIRCSNSASETSKSSSARDLKKSSAP
jgi:hypothetical protein